MFETSVVRAQTGVAARSRAGLLTISIVAHTAVILGVTAVSVASVEFPDAAPNETTIFIPTQPPPPLGTPDGGGPKPAAAPPQEKPATPPLPPNQITAPPEIPDEVPAGPPSTAAADPGEATALPGDGTGTGTQPGSPGQPWGVPGGVGDLDAPPSTNTAPAVEEKVYQVGGEVKAPVLVRRVDPDYPEVMRRIRQKATVVVKCIIDKNGNVRDLEIVRGAMPPFNDAVMNAVRQWRYQPGSYRGQAVDTWLHVTVEFGIR